MITCRLTQYGKSIKRPTFFADRPVKLFTRDHKVIPYNYKVFTTVFVVKHMINDNTYWYRRVERLRTHIDEYTEVDKAMIGFPENWYYLLKV
ncbi:hypothetical protein GCM10010911_49520 [Paenibacillus nasutitermitis]|uniref:Uncharacterized protein n=1 Tax=Paenibacillus nasutitermitis TaxID=1652958 RepID=A0A916ZB30_9BACL|nr:hypothetical protein GCM10010911_49520 [Paenibacillus nasutitermitis]